MLRGSEVVWLLMRSRTPDCALVGVDRAWEGAAAWYAESDGRSVVCWWQWRGRKSYGCEGCQPQGREDEEEPKKWV